MYNRKGVTSIWTVVDPGDGEGGGGGGGGGGGVQKIDFFVQTPLMDDPKHLAWSFSRKQRL